MAGHRSPPPPPVEKRKENFIKKINRKKYKKFI
jgi:hypothetical protein